LFWISSLFSNMGTWMQQIAQPWILLNLTNSPFWIGLDSFALNAPSLLFTLWGGVLADVRDRRRTVLFFQGIQFLCVLVLVLLLMLGQLRVWIIVLTSFLIGLTDSLSMPSFQSIVPSLVKKNEIHKAVSLNSTQFNLSRILGPAVAGLVIVKFGALACFGSNAASYIPFFLSLYFIYPRNRSLPKKEIVQTKSVSQFLELKTFLLQPKIRLPLSVTFLNGLFCGPLITFCIVLIRTNFHEDVSGFGGAMTAFGAGGLLGATSSFLILPAYLRRNELSSALAILLSLFILAISLNHSIYLLYVLLVCTGAALTASNTHINTFLQENADNRIRGRIASLYQLAISGGLSLGALWMGFITDRFSISTALLVNGLLALLFQILIFGLQVKHIRQFTSADKSN
jgi:MFS family permease